MRVRPASLRSNRAQLVQRYVRLVAFDPTLRRSRRDVKGLARQKIKPFAAFIHNNTMPR